MIVINTLLLLMLLLWLLVLLLLLVRGYNKEFCSFYVVHFCTISALKHLRVKPFPRLGSTLGHSLHQTLLQSPCDFPNSLVQSLNKKN